MFATILMFRMQYNICFSMRPYDSLLVMVRMNDACGPVFNDTKSRWYGGSVHGSNENVSISEHDTMGLLRFSTRRITNFCTLSTASEFRHIIAANDVP